MGKIAKALQLYPQKAIQQFKRRPTGRPYVAALHEGQRLQTPRGRDNFTVHAECFDTEEQRSVNDRLSFDRRPTHIMREQERPPKIYE